MWLFCHCCFCLEHCTRIQRSGDVGYSGCVRHYQGHWRQRPTIFQQSLQRIRGRGIYWGYFDANATQSVSNVKHMTKVYASSYSTTIIGVELSPPSVFLRQDMKEAQITSSANVLLNFLMENFFLVISRVFHPVTPKRRWKQSRYFNSAVLL